MLLLLGFAVARLIFRCRRSERPGWNWQALRDQVGRLDLCLVCLGSMFLLYYLAAMFPRPNLQYANLMGLPLAQVISFYFEVDLLAWLFLAIVLRRIYLIMRGRAAFSPLWDGLAIGAVVYFMAFLWLRLASIHYTAALDLIAVLYLGRLAVLASERMQWRARVAAFALALVIVFQAVSISAFRVSERKNYIHAKVELANVIVAQYRGREGIGLRLFFPFAGIYPLTEFASYLSYRGVPLEGDSSESTRSKRAVIVRGVVAKEGSCVPYRSFVCHPGIRPEPGDLVIELPDDLESLGAISPYQSGGESLLSYAPHPRIPLWLYPFVARLRVAAVTMAERDKLSDRWLHASVTEWEESNPPSAERQPSFAPGGR